MNTLLKQIRSINKAYFTLNDVLKISTLAESSLKVSLTRLVRSKLLTHLTHNYYALDPSKVAPEKIALELEKPSYLSFEWALTYYNILSQKSYQITLATPKRHKDKVILDIPVSYRHLQPKLFWGYEKKADLIIASPEKALIDLVYLALRGYAEFDPDAINWSLLDFKKLKQDLAQVNNSKLTSQILNYL